MLRRTARALIVYNGQTLLMERWRPDEHSGEQLHYFSIVGGTVEENEALEQALVRELSEETGVEVTVRRLLAVQSLAAEQHNYFLCEYVSGEPQLKSDSVEAERAKDGLNMYSPGWVPVQDLTADMLHPIYRPILPLLRDIAAGHIPSKLWQF